MSNPNEESQQQQQLQVLNLFERVTEPFTPKPDIVFDIVQPIPGDPFNIPELELVKAIPRGSLFSSFHPGHREAAYTLIRIFKSKQILYSPKKITGISFTLFVNYRFTHRTGHDQFSCHYP